MSREIYKYIIYYYCNVITVRLCCDSLNYSVSFFESIFCVAFLSRFFVSLFCVVCF